MRGGRESQAQFGFVECTKQVACTKKIRDSSVVRIASA